MKPIFILYNYTLEAKKIMSKRIVFCADGTWDTATSHTNVYKLYKSLTVSADQMPFYDDGVGASGNPILKVIGGAFGTGLWPLFYFFILYISPLPLLVGRYC